jgi:hypothetical protein
MIVPPDPGIVLRPRRATPSDVRWAERADELEFETLTRVRAASEKWAASLAAILGLTGAVFVVKGRDDVSKLDTPYQVAVGILLLVALIVAAIATYLAARAAQGTPTDVKWPNGGKLRRWEHEEALAARKHLRASRVLALVTVSIVVLAIGLTWFGEAKPASADSSAVVILRATGAPLCGTLISARGPGEVALDAGDAPPVALPAATLRAIVPVAGCPPAKDAK